jgi:Protein of unknown function (DUF3089)
MHQGPTQGSARTIEWRAWLVAAVGAAAFVVPGVTAGAARAETTWLCKPGLASNPCESSEETTVQQGNGSSSVETPQPASNPPIDCFYVYPTVSGEEKFNSDLTIEPEEEQVAIDQASRFSQQCKVYAPMYEQLTLYALKHPTEITVEDRLKAYLGVAAAFEEYLAKYNNGRGFVLIGHSQGALMLKNLIKVAIDPSAPLRKRLISAILLGGNVLVPKGGTVGADFENVPACQSAGQTHCVVAYSSFLEEPPEPSYFGRVKSALLGPVTPEQEANDEVLCVNPAVANQGEGAGALQRIEATKPIKGFPFEVPSAPTPWASLPGQYTGQCEHKNGASWLQLKFVGPEGDKREKVAEVLGREWGTHLNDVNIALGNLVGMTGLEAATYKAERLAEETPPPLPELHLPPVTLPPPPISSPLASPSPPTTKPGSAASHKGCKRQVRRRRGSRKTKVTCAKQKRRVRKHKPPAHKH